MGSLLKEPKENVGFSRSNKIVWGEYDLWNEGIKSPIALNLLLDELVDMFQKEYDAEYSSSKYSKSMDWGDYWNKNFINGNNK